MIDSINVFRIIVTVLYTLHFAVTIPLIILRRNIQPLKARQVNILILYSAVLLLNVYYFILELFTIPYLPCRLEIYFYSLIESLWSGIIAIRVWRIWLVYIINTKQLQDITSSYKKIKQTSTTRYALDTQKRTLQLFLQKIIIIISLLSLIAALILDFAQLTPCYGNNSTLASNITFTFLVLVSMIFATVLLYKMWHTNDAFHLLIELKIIVGNAYFAMIFIIFYRNKDWGYYLVITCILLVFTLVSVTLPILESFRKRSAVLELQSQPVVIIDHSLDSLYKVIEDPKAIEYFQRFLVEELSVENLLFVQSVAKLKKITDNELEMRVEANEIFTHYIIERSISEVNIDSNTRSKIIEKFSHGDIMLQIFDDAVTEIMEIMETGNFIRFRRSDLYLKMIQELNGQQLPDPPVHERIHMLA